MIKLSVSIILSVIFLNQINAQTTTEEICMPGFNRAGNCGFFRNIELTTPQAQRATNFYVNTFTRNAFKDYSNLPYTSVRFELGGGSGGSTKFQDVNFHLLDENDQIVQTIPALVPATNEFIEQEINLNGAHKLQIAFTGFGTTGEAGFYKITEITEIREPFDNCDVLFCYDQKVGIGTSSPDAKLTVKGKIHSEEVKVDLNVPGPDYVFESEYQLRTLKETKDYITRNKHLPEIPSAKEMEANGVELGDMNMRLLKKIEELTLYIIEQNERLEKAEEKIQQLENK